MRWLKTKAQHGYHWFITRDARRKRLEANVPWAPWLLWVFNRAMWFSAPAAAMMGLGKLAFLMAAAVPVIVWFIWTGK